MKIVAAILAAFCLAHFQHVSAEIKVFQKSHVDLTKRLVFDPYSYVDGQLTYALCDKNLQNDEIKCTVFREKKPYGDASYSCDVTLKRADKHSVERAPRIELIPFGKNNVLLTMREAAESHLIFTTVQMDSCKVAETAFDTKGPISFIDLNVVGHSDSYDVFYRNEQVSCDGKVCKATIDANGKLISGPSSSMEKYALYDGFIYSILPLDDNNSKHGYFYLKHDGQNFVYTLLKNDGTEKSLGRLRDPHSIMLIPAATNNKLIGVCYPLEQEFKCNQYDFEGTSKLETTLPKHDDYTSIWDIYNLPNGGFYTVSSKWEEKTYVQYLIERVDSTGKRTGSIKFQGLAKHKRQEYTLAPFFYENENKETCVSAVAFDSLDTPGPEEGKGHLYLTGNCFTDADFSK